MTPELPPAALDRAREVAQAAPPMSDGMRSDLRLIIWGPAAIAAAAQTGPAEAA